MLSNVGFKVSRQWCKVWVKDLSYPHHLPMRLSKRSNINRKELGRYCKLIYGDLRGTEGSANKKRDWLNIWGSLWKNCQAYCALRIHISIHDTVVTQFRYHSYLANTV